MHLRCDYNMLYFSMSCSPLIVLVNFISISNLFYAYAHPAADFCKEKAFENQHYSDRFAQWFCQRQGQNTQHRDVPYDFALDVVVPDRLAVGIGVGVAFGNDRSAVCVVHDDSVGDRNVAVAGLEEDDDVVGLKGGRVHVSGVDHGTDRNGRDHAARSDEVGLEAKDPRRDQKSAHYKRKRQDHRSDNRKDPATPGPAGSAAPLWTGRGFRLGFCLGWLRSWHPGGRRCWSRLCLVRDHRRRRGRCRFGKSLVRQVIVLYIIYVIYVLIVHRHVAFYSAQ